MLSGKEDPPTNDHLLTYEIESVYNSAQVGSQDSVSALVGVRDWESLWWVLSIRSQVWERSKDALITPVFPRQ